MSLSAAAAAAFYAPIKDAGNWVKQKIVASLKAQVTYLKYDHIRNHPGSYIVFIQFHPKRYFARMKLINNSISVTYIKQMTISLNDGEPILWAEKSICLGPAELKKLSIIFPFECDNKPLREGKYTIKIEPTCGRAITIKGQFPVDIGEAISTE